MKFPEKISENDFLGDKADYWIMEVTGNSKQTKVVYQLQNTYKPLMNVIQVLARQKRIITANIEINADGQGKTHITIYFPYKFEPTKATPRIYGIERTKEKRKTKAAKRNNQGGKPVI